MEEIWQVNWKVTSCFPSTSQKPKHFHTLAFNGEGASVIFRSAISCLVPDINCPGAALLPMTEKALLALYGERKGGRYTSVCRENCTHP